MVNTLVAVLKADFGDQWARQFACQQDVDFWKQRTRQRLDGVPSDVIIDGYERAVKECSPHMPKLNDLVRVIKTLHGERTRAAEQIETASMPRIPAGTGLAGVIEHLGSKNRGNDLAQQHIALMREILARPPAKDAAERAERLDAALAHHNELLAKMPKRKQRGEIRECQAAGCRAPGTLSHATNGEGPWFCREHFRHD